MATFKICVFEHQKRADDKYPVSIRVTWNRESAYIGTEYYVTSKQVVKKKQITANGKKKESLVLKDIFIINELNKRIAKFEDLKSKKLGFRINMYSARELAKYFDEETKPGSDSTINFIEFSRTHIENLIAQGRKTTATGLISAVNAMVDYCNGREKIAITEITAKFLNGFEKHLRSERVMKRKNQFGNLVTIKRKGLSDIGIIDYMTSVRLLFNAAIKEYNDEDKEQIRIMHYPFRQYKLQRRPENEKRNITVEQIRLIRDVKDEQLQLDRAIIARDVFILSFYLAGMNLMDLYSIEKYSAGRISYNRSKTKGRRQDKAFISIKVEPEAVELLKKYSDKTGERIFDFYSRYTTPQIFSANVNKGLKIVAKACEIKEPLSTYYARHSWATIARNRCGISKDDVDLALNHIDQGRKMADVYIEKDWSMVDRANRAVIDLINKTETVNNV